MTDELMPAFRQAEPLGHTMSVGVFGDSPRNYYHAYPLAGWGDLDAPDPLLEVLGERRYEALFEPLDGVVAEHELIIARPRPDLTGIQLADCGLASAAIGGPRPGQRALYSIAMAQTSDSVARQSKPIVPASRS